MKVLVLGVGNPTLGDDSLGLYVARGLKEKISGKKLKIEVDIEESSLDWLTIAEKMIGYDEAILIDTLVVVEERLEGKIFKFDLKGSDDRHKRSYTLHNLGLPSALEIIRNISPEETPKKIIAILVGIRKPKEYSDKLSPIIKRAAPMIIKEVLDEISKSNKQ
ncbi:MAG: hydrogenase maturation protease [Candidatus Bathyarchaeia archaeon]|nr:hydrogenase maturation protease [Candidatus Bathyarchaeota archaeon]